MPTITGFDTQNSAVSPIKNQPFGSGPKVRLDYGVERLPPKNPLAPSCPKSPSKRKLTSRAFRLPHN